MRRLLILAGALALSAPPLAAQQLTATRRAPILLLPTSAARRIGAVRGGQRMLLLSQVNGYDRVLLPTNSVGWVDTSSLRRAEPRATMRRLALPPMALTVAVIRADTTASMRRAAAARRATMIADRDGPAPARHASSGQRSMAVVREAAFVMQQGAPTGQHEPAAIDVPRAASFPLTLPATKPIVLDAMLPAWTARVLASAPVAAVRADSGATTTALAALPHPAPREEHDAACADIGRARRDGAAVDTATDLLKNRVDDGRYRAVSFGDVLRLPWTGLARRRGAWTAAQRRTVARDEGAAVSLDGYIVAWRTEGPEQTNCELPDAAWRDWHVWLVRTEAEASARDRNRAIVVEITPRVRQLDAGRFDLRQIERWAREGRRVRVSGWLLLDPDHPDQVGKTRGTTWEIHPVMRIAPAP